MNSNIYSVYLLVTVVILQTSNHTFTRYDDDDKSQQNTWADSLKTSPSAGGIKSNRQCAIEGENYILILINTSWRKSV